LGNYQKLSKDENMLSRAQNRLEVKQEAAPKLPQSVQNIEKQIEQEQELKKSLQSELQNSRLNLLGLDDIRGYQSLKLSISDLAVEHRVQIDSNKDLRGSGSKQSTTTLDSENEWRRPLSQYSITAGFMDLRYFLRDLGKLPYAVAPVFLEIEAITEEDNQPADSGKQLLRVSLVLAL
jgi:hypothetical protein